jgi:DNA adenine methylase
MDDGEHRDLLSNLVELEGMVVLSGYPSEIYTECLPDWTCYSTSARISAARGTASRTECIWLNPACVDRVSQIGLDLGERA